jgi:hypothetical protein
MTTVNVNAKELVTSFDETANELEQLLSVLSEQQINAIAFEGCWTPGQVAQHLVMSNSGFAEIINGAVKETEGEPDELVETIKREFLDFSIKMESPDFVVPPNIIYRKEELMRSLEDIRRSIRHAIQTLDLTKTCTFFELPGYGYLTRLEAIYFVIYHTKRHIHQLKNISKKIR